MIDKKKIIDKYRDYFFLFSFVLISLFLISSDKSDPNSSGKKMFFTIFALNNTLVNDLIPNPNLSYRYESEVRKSAELMLENSLLRKYGIENIQLKEMLKFKDSSKNELVFGEIVGRDLSHIKGFLIINLSKSDSIQPGMTVITSDGFLGIVEIVTNNYSKISTLQNSNTKITVSVERSGINGMLEWNGKKIVMRNIPSNYDVRTGDRIVVASISAKYEPNIPIGIIKAKSTSISGFVSDFEIEPFNKVESIRNCFILKKTNLQIQEVTKNEEL